MQKLVDFLMLLWFLFVWVLFIWWIGSFSEVRAHEAPSGMPYDFRCCNKQDCAVVIKQISDDKGIKFYTQLHHRGVYFTWKEIQARKRGHYNTFDVKNSTDGYFHVCADVNQTEDGNQTYWVYCLYVPAGS